MAVKQLATRHIIESQQFSRFFLDNLFVKTSKIKRRIQESGGAVEDLKGKLMATLFYEPSTRTRLSFESAMLRLGGRVAGTENAEEFSSAVKGETLEDTIRVVAGYADVIVLRHKQEGASQLASDTIRAMRDLDHMTHVVNAGDGCGQHPTQALLDIYTIQCEFCQNLDNISVAMCGDLFNGRTVRSLAYLLSKYSGVKIYFVAPEELQMKRDVRDFLFDNGVEVVCVDDIRDVAPMVNVVYQTRVQKERGSVMDSSVNDRFVISREVINSMKNNSVVMHPLPRVDEIAHEVDAHPRAAYFRQAHNGLYVRMALLQLLFEETAFTY